MKIIGITGGVGAGKSELLKFIEMHYNCRIIRADEAAHEIEQPGQACYHKLVTLLGTDILNADKTIDKAKMAEKIFQSHTLLLEVNQLIHPAVKRYICDCIHEEQTKDTIDYFFIEAALLIEEGYDLIVDEMWYIHTDAEIRSQRLQESRHYTSEKAESIMKQQLSEEEFRSHCQVEITNNGDLEDTYRQIKNALGVRK